jgi:hypothetical protein
VLVIPFVILPWGLYVKETPEHTSGRVLLEPTGNDLMGTVMVKGVPGQLPVTEVGVTV